MGRPVHAQGAAQRLADKGYGRDALAEVKAVIHAEASDLVDVLAYIAFALPPRTRAERMAAHRARILAGYDDRLAAFLDFVLTQYAAQGEQELDSDKLGPLLALKYHTISDAAAELGGIPTIRGGFLGFQPELFRDAPG